MHLLKKLPDERWMFKGCPPCQWAEIEECGECTMEEWFATNWNLWRGMEGMSDALVVFGKAVIEESKNDPEVVEMKYEDLLLRVYCRLEEAEEAGQVLEPQWAELKRDIGDEVGIGVFLAEKQEGPMPVDVRNAAADVEVAYKELRR